jgi:Tfp pilus assembly pilus retraction ATPase PilT
MLGTSAIRNLIREDKVAQMYSSIQAGGSLGMQTLDMSLKELVTKAWSLATMRGRRRGHRIISEGKL